ncbi:hypothetical protein MP228_008773 [Amoeboaphelidium protococcarum]|nr:hypothetical protein MP228_008773 [Amoeboaphelidium protococcarum]
MMTVGADLNNSLTNLRWLLGISRQNSTTSDQSSNSSNPDLQQQQQQQQLQNSTQQNLPPPEKPNLSYAQMIVESLQHSPNGKLSLSEIQEAIMIRYPYYNNDSKTWRNSVRHTLSANNLFKRVGRGTFEFGKGSYWTIAKSRDDDAGGGEIQQLDALLQKQQQQKYQPKQQIQSNGHQFRHRSVPVRQQSGHLQNSVQVMPKVSQHFRSTQLGNLGQFDDQEEDEDVQFNYNQLL